MSNKEILKNYLDDFASKDPAFAEKYEPNKLDACWNFITDAARKAAEGENSICIEDSTVFKWARDFFIDGASAKAEIDKPSEIPEEVKKQIADSKAEAEKYYKLYRESLEQLKAAPKPKAKDSASDEAPTLFDMTEF